MFIINIYIIYIYIYIHIYAYTYTRTQNFDIKAYIAIISNLNEIN